MKIFRFLMYMEKNIFEKAELYNHLGDTLNLKQCDVQIFVNKFPAILRKNNNDLRRVTSLILEKNFSKEIFHKYPWLFFIPPKEIEYAFNVDPKFSWSETKLPLLVTYPKTQQCMKKWHEDKAVIPNYVDRVVYLSNYFECDNSIIINKMENHRQLIKVNMKKIVAILNLVSESQMEKALVLKSDQFLNSSYEMIKLRLEECQKYDVVLKPTSLLYKRSKFKKSVENYKGIKNDRYKYFAQNLECKQDYIMELLEKNNLENLSIKQFSKVTEYLQSEGFSAYHIRTMPKVYRIGVPALKRRAEALKAAEIDPIHLWQLCSDQPPETLKNSKLKNGTEEIPEHMSSLIK